MMNGQKMTKKEIKVKECPMCRSRDRKLMYTPIRDSIKSYIYDCNNCGFRYNGIKLIDKNLKILDSKFITGYTKKNKFSRVEELYNHKLSKIENYMNKSPKNNKLRILDLGCGVGVMLSAAMKRGWKGCGVDPSISCCEVARSKGLTVESKTLTEIGYKNNYFDLITAIEVIEHFEDPVKEFTEMRRTLKKDGLIVIQTANVGSLNFIVKGGKAPYYYYDHLCYYSMKTIKMMLKKLNLKIVRAIPDEISLKHRIKSCNNLTQKIKWTMFYAMRALFLNKPYLCSMTLYIKKV
jgi:2-polyprenyl-3-methyl-5-hydroxy-6-metoxy-1,4-benzoquinol methylase